MKLNKALLFLSFFLITIACNKEDAIEIIDPSTVEGAIKIMPLGDSRVEGARPDFESYRYELWKNIIDNNLVVDFVGERKDEANYATYQGNNFDRDHEGTGGAVTDDILATIQDITVEDAPDIVLLDIGGNDLLEGSKDVNRTIANIDQIIDYFQMQNENIVIILEQIAPGQSSFMTPALIARFNEFNSKIPEVADRQTTATSTVTFANMAKDWMDDWLADPVHYNEEGAKIVADRYFEVLDTFLIGE